MNQPRSVSGLTTVETVVVLGIFGVVLISLTGLHLVALSTGTLAETSSVAANLARARMEELLVLPSDQLKALDNITIQREVPPGQGRTYTVHTAVTSPDPRRLDVVVTVTWRLAFAGACASAASLGDCAGHFVTYSRTLQTRVQAPGSP